MLKSRYYKQNIVTDDIIQDRFISFDYKPLSKKEEVSFIKKLKLSYYDEVDDNLKQQYLNYYFDEFPGFKEKYEKSLEKEQLLEEAIINATWYRDNFIMNNGRLVFSVVKKISGVDNKFEDLFQEGVLGMMRALEKFDITEGYKFSTYAIWWIRESVIRYYHNQSRTIRIPIHLSENVSLFEKTMDNLSVQLGRTPSNEEIAISMGISKKYLNRILKAKTISCMSSLDGPVDSDSDSTIGDFIIDEEDQFEVVDNKSISPILRDEIAKLNLNVRDRQILYMCYGLDGEEPKSLEQIAKKFNITKERVRQIEKSILNKLRLDINVIGLHDIQNRHVNDYKVKTIK